MLRVRVLVAVTLAVLAGGSAMPAPAQAPAPVPPACVTFKAAGDSGVFVNLANGVSPEAIAHVQAAVRAGQPRLLHWDPADADAHRAASLRGIKTWGQLPLDQRERYDPDTGRFDAPAGSYALATAPHDRDEYPPASSAEGGTGADVRYILSSDNRSAGQRLGAVMGGFCALQPFIVEP
jgi:Deoxyribonuclease NucA/NucB